MIIEITLDATTFIKGLRKIESNVFVAISEFDELDSVLNCNGIGTQQNDTES